MCIGVPYFFVFFYILLNIIGGHLITRDYLEYTGPIISEADIPLVQKKQAVKYIAEDWKLNSNSQKVPIGFYFPAKIWSWINEFGEKYSPFYPNVYILGREYDYELLRIYNLYNSQEGIQHRTFNGVKYIICYKAYPLQIKKALVSEVKIFGQLMVIKLKSI